MRRLIFASILAATAPACGDDSKSALATAVTDTLPGGIPRVTSPGPTAWADTNGWKLVEILRIEASVGDSAVLGYPISVALDSEDRIFVAETRPAVIKVFDRAGRLIRTVGRDGQGPGEFEFPLVAVHGGSLVVHDARQSRMSVFDTSGTFVRSWVTPCCDMEPVVVDAGGLVYIGGMGPADSGRMVVRYSLEGVPRDTLYLPRPPERQHWQFPTIKGPMPVDVPLTPMLLQRTNPAGGFLTGMTGEYTIAASRGGPDTIMIFTREWTTNRVSNHRRREAADSVIDIVAEVSGEATARREIDPGDIPATAPAFSDIAVDRRGNRWITIDPGDDSTHTWFDVFDSTGVYLGKVAGPAKLSRWRAAWGDDAMVAYVENVDGEPAVVKYEIRRCQPTVPC